MFVNIAIIQYHIYTYHYIVTYHYSFTAKQKQYKENLSQTMARIIILKINNFSHTQNYDIIIIKQVKTYLVNFDTE